MKWLALDGVVYLRLAEACRGSRDALGAVTCGHTVFAPLAQLESLQKLR
jgi:hypothetical protein